jgi:YegS/Rv2252/BmrU family lipid kinase
VTPPLRFVVLVNPDAGSVGEVAAADLPPGPVADAVEALRGDGTAEVDVVVVDGPDAVRRAVESVGDGVVAMAGGDGTLHRTLNALRDRDHVYLLIPAGTGNDFAGGVGLPVDLAAAVGLGSTGRARALDLLDLGDLLAVNAVHIGIGVEAAQAASDLKGALGKLAYPAGAVAAAARFEPVTATVVVDGDVVLDAEPVAMVGLCNGPTIGGGTRLCPVAAPADGLVDLVVLRATTTPALAATAAALLRAAHLQRDDVLHRRGESVEVTVHDAGETVTWNVDGELVERPPHLSCAVRPRAWRLLLP